MMVEPFMARLHQRCQGLSQVQMWLTLARSDQLSAEKQLLHTLLFPAEQLDLRHSQAF